MTSTLYSFKDHPEHEAQLDAWAQKWIANALSTEPANQPVMIDAINGLYDAAALPRPLHISFVKSPLAMAVAGGIASGVWWLRGNRSEHKVLFGRELTEDELMAAIAPACEYAVTVGMGFKEPFSLAATASATDSATASATDSATYSATDSATDSATASATASATRSATRSATDSATDSATYSATRSATYSAPTSALVAFLVRCTSGWWKLQDGGSDWSAWPSFLSFFDRVAGIELPIYEKWRHYEAAALNGGQRVMHEKFCIISDRHTEIHLDQNNNLHREDGPAKAYGDGWALNYWHGIAVPRDFFEWDTKRALAERNSEIRRAAIERLGWETVVDQLTLVASAPDPGNAPHEIRLYDLPSSLQDMFADSARILVVSNASLDKGGHRRVFGLPVPAHHSDPVAAAADLFGVPVAAYRQMARAS